MVKIIAGVSWSNIPVEDGRCIWLAWMSNWQYARKVPTKSWRSAMTIPRELSLKKYPEGIRMIQQPVRELKKLRDKGFNWQNIIVEKGVDLLSDLKATCLEIKAEFEIDSISESELADEFGFKVRKSADQETVIAYNIVENRFFVDRNKSGEVDFNQGFPGRHSAILKPEDGKVLFHILVDWSSVEVFGNNGQVSITDLIFPDQDSDGLELYCNNGKVKLNSLDIYYFNSIWGN